MTRPDPAGRVTADGGHTWQPRASTAAADAAGRHVTEELRFVPDTLATYAGDRAGPLTHPIVELGSTLRGQLGHPERIRIQTEAAE